MICLQGCVTHAKQEVLIGSSLLFEAKMLKIWILETFCAASANIGCEAKELLEDLGERM